MFRFVALAFLIDKTVILHFALSEHIKKFGMNSLTHMSKSSLTDHDQGGGPGDQGGSSKRKWGGEDVTSRIFNIIRDYSTSSRSQRIELKLVEAMVLRKGFTEQQLKQCLEEYRSLDIIQMNSTGTHIDLLSS